VLFLLIFEKSFIKFQRLPLRVIIFHFITRQFLLVGVQGLVLSLGVSTLAMVLIVTTQVLVIEKCAII